MSDINSQCKSAVDEAEEPCMMVKLEGSVLIGEMDDFVSFQD